LTSTIACTLPDTSPPAEEGKRLVGYTRRFTRGPGCVILSMVKPTAVALVLAVSLGAGEAHANAVQPAGGAIQRAGDVGAILLPVGAAAGALIARDDRGLAELAEAYASAMAVVYVLKPLVDRTRPDGGSQSFPSGHAASAFAGAAFLQIRYGWCFGIPAYAVASFVGYSRVESKRHYTSDVVAGAAIGIATNLLFTHPRRRVSVAFDLGRGHAGSRVTVAW
jgi:membrane-associated phospholipid phosphatase